MARVVACNVILGNDSYTKPGEGEAVVRYRTIYTALNTQRVYFQSLITHVAVTVSLVATSTTLSLLTECLGLVLELNVGYYLCLAFWL